MVTENDFDTTAYPEVIDIISRGESSLLTDAIAAAEGEAIGYLSYYNTDALFALVGTERDNTLMLRVKDIAMWHFIAVSNAGTDMQLRLTRYEQAIKWLGDIQRSKIIMKNWPLPTAETPGQNDSWKAGSKIIRDTSF